MAVGLKIGITFLRCGSYNDIHDKVYKSTLLSQTVFVKYNHGTNSNRIENETLLDQPFHLGIF